MKVDDDHEDTSSSTTTRYPCMPSLVALQQMRNRLHLAFVGKKLMKWTAQATGRELRKLALELIETCDTFREDTSEAFILLARARYFYPNLNKMVLELIGREANVTVDIKLKPVSGVKVLHFQTMDNGIDKYEHLGIEKGGQAILEAKQAWKYLLKRVIFILEQKITFLEVDSAHKGATKKMNVLAKIVIPRTVLSINYIIEILEELDREEFFRLKKVLQVKKNKDKCHHEKLMTCPVCQCKKCISVKKKEVNDRCIICGALLHTEELRELMKNSEGEIEDNERKLEEFKAQIGEIVELTKEIDQQGIVSASVEDFLKSAEQLREKLEDKSGIEKLEPIPSDTLVEKLCDSCKMRFKLEQGAKNLPVPQKSAASIKSDRLLKEANVYEFHAQKEIDLELGTFETEVQEITQVIRVRNEDGSVTEEKKVIRIKREIRNPTQPNLMHLETTDPLRLRTMSQTSEMSNECTTYCNSKTVGAAMVKNSRVFQIKTAKSEVIECSSPMADPMVRSCLSTISCITLESTSVNLGFLSNNESFSVEKIRELTASSTNFEEILRLFEIHTQNNKVNSAEVVQENCCLTESERNLMAKITDKTQKNKSKSYSNIRKELKKNPKKSTSLSNKQSADNESISNEMNNNV